VDHIQPGSPGFVCLAPDYKSEGLLSTKYLPAWAFVIT
jgi:hypothetical protein